MTRPARTPPPLPCIFQLILACGLIAVNGETVFASADTEGSWTLLPSDSTTASAWDVYKSDSTLKHGGATHMALVRGANDTSWVLHWSDGHQARLWYARAGESVTMARNVPYEALATTAELFCSGHSLLPDGRLCVVGGTLTDPVNAQGIGTTGTRHVAAFHAPSWQWSVLDTMLEERWYPTSTTLGDGRVLATGGRRYEYLSSFGGRTSLDYS